MNKINIILKTFGIYRPRIETILNSKSKYIILIDSDYIYLNEYLSKHTYLKKIQI